MKKIVFGLCVLVVLLLLAAGCGKSKPQEDLTKGKLRGNVSAMDWGEEPNIITKINKARVTVVEAGLFDDTDNSGNYLISGIIPGTYTVKADYSTGTTLPFEFFMDGGYKLNNEEIEEVAVNYDDPSITVSNVTITAGVTTTLDFILYGY